MDIARYDHTSSVPATLTLPDTFAVSLEIHGPLIQGTRDQYHFATHLYLAFVLFSTDTSLVRNGDFFLSPPTASYAETLLNSPLFRI